MTILVVAPGARIATMDVFEGVVSGLRAHGVNTPTYSLHGRIVASEHYVRISHSAAKRQAKLEKKPFVHPAPTFADVCYQACTGIFEKIFRFRVDAVLFVSGVLIPPDVLRIIKHAQMPIGLLLTESPYLSRTELEMVAYADVVWTNERSFVPALRAQHPHASYLPHAWSPHVHGVSRATVKAASHDVVFVGTDFPERVALLEGVDWTGIDLGLYGNWRTLRDDSPLRPFVKAGETPNTVTAALYRQAKIGLNIYRTSSDGHWASPAESLNPRAYELAAVGTFHVSTPRAEVGEKFGSLVPTCTTSAELDALLRYWLPRDAERQAIAARLPASVAEDTWIARGGQVLADMRRLTALAA